MIVVCFICYLCSTLHRYFVGRKAIFDSDFKSGTYTMQNIVMLFTGKLLHCMTELHTLRTNHCEYIPSSSILPLHAVSACTYILYGIWLLCLLWKVYPFHGILTHMFGTIMVIAADENLTFAFEHCHCRARGNKRQECIRRDPSLLIHMHESPSSMDVCLHCGVLVRMWAESLSVLPHRRILMYLIPVKMLLVGTPCIAMLSTFMCVFRVNWFQVMSS